MEVALTKMSSKGQIVIPVEMRKGLKEGDKIFLIKGKNAIVIRKAKSLDASFIEDMEFVKMTEEAYKRYDRGEFIEMPGEKFLKELERW